MACLAVAALAAVNLHAVSAFNQATASLTRNIEDSGKDTVDYGKLRTRQEQTDAQFEQAASMEPVLLPSVKAAIQANAAVSARLTELAKLRLSEQQEGSGAQNDAAQSQPQQQEQQEQNAANGGGLTDEQRQKVEELLKANEQSTPAESTTTEQGGQSAESTTTNNSGNSSKPW